MVHKLLKQNVVQLRIQKIRGRRRVQKRHLCVGVNVDAHDLLLVQGYRKVRPLLGFHVVLENVTADSAAEQLRVV